MKRLRLDHVLMIAACLFLPQSTIAESSGEPKLAVTNHATGSTVRYAVVLLRGTLPPQAKSMRIENAQAPEHAGKVRPVVHDGRFKALVELSPGENAIRLSTESGSESAELKLNYQPQTNRHYVRLVWMTANDGDTTFAAPTKDTPQDYETRLRTAGLLMQTFTAERMHELGYGRRTFRLERDANGRVVVHTWKGPETREDYYALGDSNRWWNNVRLWLNREHPDPMAKNVVLAAYTRKDARTGKMKGHTALGGANLGLFGSASVFSWPRSVSTAADVFRDTSKYDVTKVHDDSVGRKTIWGLASTTIGATLHETGHAFGLPHCGDRFGIMRRGFDHFNRCFTFHDPPSGRNRKPVFFSQDQEAYFAPESASYLRWSRWFHLDEKKCSAERPTIKLDRKAGTVEIDCAVGIPWVGFHVAGDIHAYREFDAREPPKHIKLTLKEIAKALNGKTLSRIRAISADGVESGLNVKE